MARSAPPTGAIAEALVGISVLVSGEGREARVGEWSSKVER